MREKNTLKKTPSVTYIKHAVSSHNIHIEKNLSSTYYINYPINQLNASYTIYKYQNIKKIIKTQMHVICVFQKPFTLRSQSSN